MKKIVITINKGGVGKTMLTKTLATAAAEAGLNVLILDMDSQENATRWRARRSAKQEKPLPLVRYTNERDLKKELESANKAGCDLVFIDTPPGKNTEAPAAVECADLVLIPFWNDQDAYEGVAKTAVLVKRLGKAAFGVLNFVPPNSHSHETTARAVLQVIPLPVCPVVLHRYDIHRLANIKGLTAQELEPVGKVAREIEALWDWFSAEVQIGTDEELQDGTVALVHKGAA